MKFRNAQAISILQTVLAIRNENVSFITRLVNWQASFAIIQSVSWLEQLPSVPIYCIFKYLFSPNNLYQFASVISKYECLKTQQKIIFYSSVVL